ncbi:MAG: hypothetical protein OEY96_10635 [Gammaproteobacteria bacterium]|nr:hypothetical protein [Gammaproteobacteria bacterium]
MDWQIRIAIILLGLMVIGFIIFDFRRKEKTKKRNEVFLDNVRKSADKLDTHGFDINGVGNVRRFSVDEPNGSSHKEAESDQPHSLPDPDMVLSLILKADDDKPFVGKSIMSQMLLQNLQYGKMEIFHYFEPGNTTELFKPEPDFSVANAISPGTFDLRDIDNFSTPAIAFFMCVPGPKDPIKSYEKMVEVIRSIRSVLGGRILDESKSAYTEQTHKHQLERLKQHLAKIK